MSEIEQERPEPECPRQPPAAPEPAPPDRLGSGHDVGPAPCRCAAGSPFADGVVELRKRRGPGTWSPAVDPAEWLEVLARRAADKADRPRA
ncbi:hypothetical protein [Streptomyces sp. NBC_01408]|uniref:hypothetical protein n=1 Tax=Streptomyces sp. NBC_01408 TaxID=2903855 RepID=UPI002259E5E6|nr:hypothetical protein [Streptomyces sp. NBC_01408]MCX4695794.1 hypothetical protein [Streptomyces sp. NBC_01408]